ncbi:hypothetical protein AN2341V1_3798 [Klebsiella pneumoniae]|nr:hypothetical protein AN2341V1_3798 [Klebsiella pneumoniae]
MKSIQDQVLDLFKDEISTRLDKNWKEIPLELDYDLFDAPGDDLLDALNKFEQKFNVDLSSVKWSCYFPWENTPMLTRWFGNDSNLLIVFYVQIMPDDFVMQLHRF